MPARDHDAKLPLPSFLRETECWNYLGVLAQKHNPGSRKWFSRAERSEGREQGTDNITMVTGPRRVGAGRNPRGRWRL